VSVISSTEANGGLLALMADINTDEHGLWGDLAAEGHAPEVTTELSVHLPDDVEEDTVIVLSNGTVRHEL